MNDRQIIDNNIEQGIAAYIDYLNNLRLIELVKAIELILTNETDKLADLAKRHAAAMEDFNWAEVKINNLIEIGRGGEKGLHGFIAEFAEVGIRNARDAFEGMKSAVELLDNNGPVDIVIHGEDVQMKFYANIVDAIKQSANYSNMKMMFPKDQFEVIKKVMEGEKYVEYNGNRLSIKKIETIREIIALKDNPYNEWIVPSVNNYRDVKKETINNTLSKEIGDIEKQAEQQEHDIKEKAANDKSEAVQQSKPSLGEASRVAGIGAAVQGGISLGIFIYKKHKSGKEIWEYREDDWKECGINTAKSAVKGGILGYAIYGLTNVCHLSAPSAGAVASGTFGLINAVISYRKGDVDTDGFIDLAILNTIDAAGAAIGAGVGQAVIPIPVVGALVGSIAVTTALSLGKDFLNKHETEVINQYQEKINAYIDTLKDEYKLELKHLLNKYEKLGELQQYAFDLDINIQLRFAYSIDFAGAIGVNENKILKSIDDIDSFMS